ncbi:hypothetical protein MJO29_009952 [Puccinia striiformis f. sp. tritici]|nr:hypothetical protein MJO29_009952 [Puccinia striiformis f. sp. tritici]
MAPMASSFRYSIKRGLEPVLPNKIAMSLAADWRIGRAIGRKNFSSPPRRQPLVQSSSFHARKIDRLLSTTPTLSSALSTATSATDSVPTPKLTKTTAGFVLPPDAFASSAITSTVIVVESQDQSATSSAINAPATSAPATIVQIVPTPEQHYLARKPPTESNDTSTTEPPDPRSISNPDLSSLSPTARPSAGLQRKIPPSRSRSLDRLPLSGCTEPPGLSDDSTLNSSTIPPSFLAIEGPADLEFFCTCQFSDLTPPESHASSTITSAHNSTPSAPIANAISDTHCHPRDLISSSSPLLNDQPCQEFRNSSNGNFTTSSSAAATTNCSINKDFPGYYDEAELVSITVLDESEDSVDAQLAQDSSWVMLEFNNDMDDYLKLSALTEIKKKKKKKKKKKDTPTSTSDNPVLFYV